MHLRANFSGLLCVLALLLAAAPGRALPPEVIGLEMRQTLRAAKTVRLEVQQDYDFSGEAVGEEEAAKPGEQKAKTEPTEKKYTLPLEELAAEAVKLTGWKLAKPGGPADVTLTIDARSTPIAADYIGTVMGRHYTGAELNGTVRLALGDQVVTEADIAAKVPVASTIHSSYYRPSDAPFSQTLPHYCEALFTVLGRACGPGPVVAGLKLENFDQQTGAGRALLAVGDASIEPALIEILGKDNELLGRLAALGLGAYGRATALPPLLAALRNDKSDAGRTNYRDPFDDELLRTLTEHRDEILPPAERPGAAREKLDDYGTRHRAVEWALLQIEAPDKLSQLTAALQSPDATMLRRGAAVVLGGMSDPRAFEPLAAATRDKEPLVRVAAVAALGRLNDERLVAVFLAVSSDSVEYVSKLAREQLTGTEQKRWRKFLESKLRAGAGRNEVPLGILLEGFAQPDPLVRAAAVNEAINRREPEIKTGLAALLRSDPQPFVREAVAESLADGDASILALALGDTDAATRRAAVQGLTRDAEEGENPEKKAARSRLPETALGPLLVLVERGELEQENAAALLARIEGPGVADALLHVLEKDRAPVVVSLIVRRLAELGDKRTVTPLLAQLGKATDQYNSQYVADALVTLEDPAVLEPLFAQLKSGTPAARRLAMSVLGRLRQPRAIGPLIAVMRTGESAGQGDLAGDARQALLTLTGKSFDRSEQWLRWWKENAGKPFVPPVSPPREG